MKLQEIQSIENNLIYQNKGSDSLMFTEFIHATREWIDTYKPIEEKKIDVNMYQINLDKDVNTLCELLKNGIRMDAACQSIGKNRETFKELLNDEQLDKIKDAIKSRANYRIYKNK